MIKKLSNLIIFAFCIAIIFISIITKPSAEINENQFSFLVPDTQFVIGAFHDGIDIIYDNTRTQLKFNTWHHYTSDSGWGWPNVTGDYYWNPNINEYGTGIMNRIDENYNHGMRTFMDRPIIEYLVGGQRVDYQCEQIGSSYEENPYWFYSYYNSVRVNNNLNYSINDVPDNINGVSETVKYCRKLNGGTIDGDILINDRLKANREMSFNAVNPWMKDSTYGWYVLPRIKIDPAFAADTNNNNTPVCRIKITGWYGNIEKDFVLRVINFKNHDYNYDGRYLQSFRLNSSDTVDYLEIERNLMHNFADTNKDNFIFNWDTVNYKCKCDIKIYWTGACDIWIDRVRIENRPAHEFLTTQKTEWLEKLNYEIDWAKLHNNTIKQIPNYFYFEEAAFSHFPAIKEINRRIRERTDNTNEIVIWLNYDLFNVHMPFYDQHWMTADQLHWYLNQEFGLNTIVMGSYALEGWPNGDRASYHPYTLTNADYNVDSMRLSHPVFPRIYDNNLQDKLDYKIGGTGLIYVYSLMDRLAKTGMNVLCCPQAHGWWGLFHRLKEPSNEELELQACLALSYNAKGIMYFAYNSFDDTIKPEHARGIINSDGSQRTYSSYGQNKFAGIKDLDIKLNKWGPYILKFDNTKTRTCIYRIDTSRANFLYNTYFKEIRASLQSPYTNCADLEKNAAYETPNSTYIQAATFSNLGETYSKYFMILNRRCSPGDDDCSGRRFITIIFDSTNTNDFAGFYNWKIIDLYNDSTICTFDKGRSIPISLGKFKPGEGKLYKLAPVLQEGGTFVTNDTVTNIEFTCKGTVNTNGNNLILGGCKVYFNSDCSITANGSELRIFSDSLFGSPHSQWNGIIAEGVSDCQIYWNNFKNIKSDFALKIINCSASYLYWNNFLLTYDNATPVNAISVDISNIQSAMTDIQGNYFQVNNSNIGFCFLQSSETSGSFYFKYNYLYS
ncbi:MAG TPA: hypothetical protein VIK14_04165, partial [Ignavibacteria bacterium]